MVTFTVLGSDGYLGSVVTRRWMELGASPRLTGEPADYVVNCIRPDDLLLSERIAETTRLIQPSTDAIAEDSDYARGKRILERIPGAVTIRAGIIDTRHDYAVAYRNWRCNPITPLEWAELAWELKDRPGLHLAGREGVSRHLVASLVAYFFDKPQPEPGWAEVPLSRIVEDDERDWNTLAEGLTEYREWLQS